MTNDHTEHMDEWALHAYADGELSPEQRAEVEALMARDPEAARKVADWKRQRELLKTAFDGVLDEPVPARMSATLRRPAGPPRVSPWLAMAAAVLLLLCGGLAGWFLKGEQPAAMADLGREALEAHSVFAVEVRHPVEVKGDDKDHLQAWLSKRVGTAFTVPDLTEQGYALLGGRLLSGEEGPAAMLMYEDQKGQRLSVLLASPGTDMETALKVEEQGKLIACTWQDGKLAVAVAGEMARDPMMALAKAVYEKLEG
ncbi:anti-sigma factor [Aestuariivirga sp.]|uniref:anti-sigma factor family protein n=1 Tax=Aestuariivirga sp. TaxID=2650926 RepID=UPI0035B0F35B